MKTLVFTCLLLLLLGCQGALTFPDSPLESYKAYLHGLCAALGLDCDLSTVSSCWDDTSAAGHLNMVYHGCLDVLKSPPKESSSVLTTFFPQGADQYVKPIEEALNCQESFPYARRIFGKISPPGKGFEGTVKNVIYHASVKPEECFTIFKNIVALAEQANFEAMGMLVGNYIVQGSAMKIKEDSDWRVNAKNSRASLLKGICKGLGLDCPNNSLNSMNEEDSATYLQFLYELIQAISRSQQDATKNGVEFFLGRGRELMGKISITSIEADSRSEEIKLINEKLGMDIWSPEFVENYIGFLNKYPDSCWHYKHAEKQLFEKNDLEGVGIIIGIAWYHFSAWNQGQFGQKMADTMTDL